MKEREIKERVVRVEDEGGRGRGGGCQSNLKTPEGNLITLMLK